VLSDWGRPVFWGYQREPSIQFPGYGPDSEEWEWPYCTEGVDCTGQYGDPDKRDGPERFIDLEEDMILDQPEDPERDESPADVESDDSGGGAVWEFALFPAINHPARGCLHS